MVPVVGAGPNISLQPIACRVDVKRATTPCRRRSACRWPPQGAAGVHADRVRVPCAPPALFQD